MFEHINGLHCTAHLSPTHGEFVMQINLQRALAALVAMIAFAAAPAVAQLAAAPPRSAAGAYADLPARLKSPTDTAVFRRFVLDNGMKVLLVSDTKFNKSGAALVVNTGQMDDPKDMEGLAHFLEHMLFLGSKKYPEVAEYGNYISTNGGSNNAYTTSDHTNYQFDVRHDAFPGALDRFAQFFIAPLFNADFTAREVNAVHNEAMRHVQNDQRRIAGVTRELFDPNSGEAKFSTGNKDTLKNATPEKVRAFYEANYSADRMALSLAGKASLDDLERMARTMFTPVPRRNVTPIAHKADFLPRKAALRMAYVEPVRELRQLSVEFVVPPMRAEFRSKPDALVTGLISYPGPGGLVEKLKRDGLILFLSASVWDRTRNYGSLFVHADLTPAGQEKHMEVLQAIHAYIAHLRNAAYPTEFFNDRARIALLQESYGNRGEGVSLATQLANQALFYPLDVAERAPLVWGKPDEAPYRRLLDALKPDNALVILAAKGVPINKQERIYSTSYSYKEDAGAAYASLTKPAKMAFALPGINRFMPKETKLVAERPMPLINEPGLQLYYLADTEFQRPQSAMTFRFVPARSLASARSAALMQLYGLCATDAMNAAIVDAALAGVQVNPAIFIDEARLTVSGYGDAPAKFATFFAAELKKVSVSPQRFDVLKELALRSMRSYVQLEANVLAGNRRDALSREVFFLPDEMIGSLESAAWSDVQAVAKQFFSAGKVEAIAHGHLTADDAVTVARNFANQIGAAALAEDQLLRRRHLAIAAGEHVIDAGPIEGPNSVYMSDYLLDDDKPHTRAAAVVLGTFIREPFFSELRTKQQLGYIVGSGFAASNRERFATSIIQSSTHGPDELRARAEAFMTTLPAAVAALPDAKWAELIAGARSTIEQQPKSIAEKSDMFFSHAFILDREWESRQETLDALDRLTKADAAAILQRILSAETAKRRTVMLSSKAHAAKAPITPSFGNRSEWKAKRTFQ
jgi:insulysin